MMNAVFWIVSILIAAALLSLVVQGTLFAGWLIGWILIIVLAALAINEIFEWSWALGCIVVVLVIVGLFNWL